MKREHEFARKQEEANSRLRKLKLTKQFNEKMAELEGNRDDIEYSETHSVKLDLPEEKREDSIQRYLQSQASVAQQSPQQPRSDVTPVYESNGLQKVAESLAEVARSMAIQSASSQQVAVTSQLPHIDLPVFSGDPLQYPLWKNAFVSLVDRNPVDHPTKLHYLNNSVAGAPKRLVQHYLLLGTEDAYKKACGALAERYGSQSVVSAAFTKKLNSWPRISNQGSTGLRDFADFLNQVEAAKVTISTLDILDFPQENVKMLEKLPAYLARKWRDEVDRWQRRGLGSYPTFSRFAEFVNDAARKASIPELECLKNQESRPRQFPAGNKGFAGKSLSTRAFNGGQQGKFSSCPFCNEKHHLDECKEFAKKPHPLRKDFFFQKKLCMGCGSDDSHQVKDCPQRKICKECQGRHLTCLHRPQNREYEGSSKCTNVCSLPDQDGKEHCMIVPVWVRHASNPGNEILQYAILDDQSNVGFVSKALCEKMRVDGTDTNLQLTTMHESTRIKTSRICGLEVLDFKKEHVVTLPACYQRDDVPARRSQIPKGEVMRRWAHLSPIADDLMPYNPAIEVGLLIGNDCPRAIRPRDIICGGEDEPYAQRSILGWGVVGTVCKSANQEIFCKKTFVKDDYPHFAYANRAKEVFSPERVLNVLEKDFIEMNQKGKPYSIDEMKFMSMLEKGVRKREDGHYEMPLPLKSKEMSLPYNKPLAIKRWNQLTARFRKNQKFQEDYKEFMKGVIADHAERVPTDRLNAQDRVNYIPHTGVYHPRKPDKIRVVFDCSAAYQGVSLNDHLLQGPNSMNSLLGVLCRFRKEEVACAVDVKSMFHQFFVSPEDRDLLRFLWWEDGNPEKQVVEYRMTVHLFGAASSPGAATFGLRKAADDGEDEFGADAAEFIRKDFYVDDGLTSVPSTQIAVKLLKDSQGICAKAGLKLHKVISNDIDVLKSFPKEDRSKEVQQLDLDKDSLSLERVLGVVWRIQNDVFNFIVEIKERPFTRRGVLSTVSSFYDPCGFISPVMLPGKRILQEMCRSNADWDTPMPEALRARWENWLEDVRNLEGLQIPRCLKPNGFGKIKQVELHHFSDASEDGYGQCTYVRFINEDDNVHCALVIGKSRVTPLRQITIPRLELAAATTSARMSSFVKEELKYHDAKDFFWTDSQVVLGYIRNEAKRFHTFVANRVQQIRDLTDPKDWFYVDTRDNPADEASRGMSAKQLTHDSRWLRGPEFLWRNPTHQAEQTDAYQLMEGDPEVRRANVMSTQATAANTKYPDQFESSRLEPFSSWYRAKKAIARCLQLKDRLRRKEVKRSSSSSQGNERRTLPPLTTSQLVEAERVILMAVQMDHFKDEMEVMKKLDAVDKICDRTVARSKKDDMKRTSALYRLDPYLDEDGLVRVGGRITRANMSRDVRHPVILPRHGHISHLVIRHYHQCVQHMGRGITHNEVRQHGFWVIGGSSAVSQCISGCVKCRSLRRRPLQQKMADLPEDRLEPTPPFTYSAVDYFGPFLVKERRSEVKRYGVLFTCMASRSVHLETANSLTGSSFINALRRFMNRRGAVRQLRSDQGTTFIGARTELRQALAEMDQSQVQDYLLQNGCDWIPFKLNVPHASHMGGVWERQIQTVRRVLEPLLQTVGTQLDDEAFRTFLTEAEAIINARPLTTTNLSDSGAPEPLTPNHLLTSKAKVVLPPPGAFQREDLYSRKWWRRVQYAANEFWARWRREYLQELQSRQKWVLKRRNLEVGDIVISKENEDARGRWPLARVVDVYPSKDGCVRKVKILIADGTLDNEGKRKRPPVEFDRPIQKLVLLLPVEK